MTYISVQSFFINSPLPSSFSETDSKYIGNTVRRLTPSLRTYTKSPDSIWNKSWVMTMVVLLRLHRLSALNADLSLQIFEFGKDRDDRNCKMLEIWVIDTLSRSLKELHSLPALARPITRIRKQVYFARRIIKLYQESTWLDFGV
jgi:hypothetical protein